MTKYLCCIHDKKSDTYDAFMLFANMSQALRSFQQACEKDETFQKWPEDFEFVLVAKFGVELGEINDKNEIVKASKLLEPICYNQVIAQARDYVALNNAKTAN